MTKQAYHARGAGRVTSFQCQDAWKAHTDADQLWCTNWAGVAEALNSLLRAPGADTGTTGAEGLSGMLAERMIKLAIKIQGPYATFGPPESLARRKKSHEERIEELTGMLTTEFAECLEVVPARGADTGTTPLDLRSAGGVETTRLMSKEECERIWPAAERGTTPPEGLDWWTEAAADVVRHARTDSSPNWQNAIVGGLLRAYNRGQDAATQRAPVEQGRDENEAARTCEKCGKTERGWKYNRCPDCGELAPDHAREGALRDLVAKWRGLRGVDWSAEPDGWKVTFNVCADELERALADGKEGGE